MITELVTLSLINLILLLLLPIFLHSQVYIFKQRNLYVHEINNGTTSYLYRNSECMQ